MVFYQWVKYARLDAGDQGRLLEKSLQKAAEGLAAAKVSTAWWVVTGVSSEVNREGKAKPLLARAGEKTPPT